MADVFELMSNFELAAALGVRYGTAGVMRNRGWIDSPYWIDLCAAVEARGFVLTCEMLCQWAKHRRSPPVRKMVSSTVSTGPPPS